VTTRVKLYISISTLALALLLNNVVMMQTLRDVSEPFHLTKNWQLLLQLIGLVPVPFTYRYLKVLKQEKAAQPGVEEGAGISVELRMKARNRLLFIMVICSISALGAPAWLPMTGTTLGWNGDFVVGVITAAVICTIVGLQLRKI
jgi:hypothetical protein